ncbi:MAG TPA: ankyrin repeat domain-containing protein [Flavipsychrobacter sp.]|nr:ankyrin repeat domain-containing protein [Flavipsychrobacter sp.]
MSDIFQAVRQNEVEVYNILIEQIDINTLDEDGQNLLHEAISHHNTLLGLDLISRNIDVNRQDKNGQTPLHYVAAHGNFEIGEAIIKAGGNPNIKDIHLNNAVGTAAFNARGKYKIVELYKKAGGDAQSKNKANRSPLDFALQINDEILIAVLEMNA